MTAICNDDAQFYNATDCRTGIY